MDKRDLFLLLQKPPINIIPSPCFEHTVDFVAQLAPWVPFSPSLFSLDRNRLQSSKFPTCSSSRTAGSSRSRPSTPPLTGEPQTRGLLRSEQPTTDQPSSSSSSHLLLLDLALQNCSSCPPPHSIPTDFRYLPDVYCIQHLRHYYFLIIRPYSYPSIISGSHFGHFDTSRHIKS